MKDLAHVFIRNFNFSPKPEIVTYILCPRHDLVQTSGICNVVSELHGGLPRMLSAHSTPSTLAS